MSHLGATASCNIWGEVYQFTSAMYIFHNSILLFILFL